MIFNGWDLSQKWPKRISLKLRKIYTTNGAHMQEYLQGTQFGFWGIDTNNKIVWLVTDLYHDNESENTCTKFI